MPFSILTKWARGAKEAATESTGSESARNHKTAAGRAWVGDASQYAPTIKAINQRIDAIGERLAAAFAERDRKIYDLEKKTHNLEKKIGQIMDATKKQSTHTNGAAAGTLPPVLNPLPYSVPPANHTDERLPDGRLNLHWIDPKAGGVTLQEQRVKAVWPEAVLPYEAQGFPRCEDEDEVVIPSNLRLIWADETTLVKLREIQNQLRRALVPYERWAQRVSLELSEDFQQVASYTRRRNPPWVTFLEAILQTLDSHHMLHSARTASVITI